MARSLCLTRKPRIIALVACVVGLTACTSSDVPAITAASARPRAQPRPRIPLSQLVGQHLMGRFTGTTPSGSFLLRIARGELGGVILVTPNITSPSGVAKTIAQLQYAARRGGQPPLLIAIDQEGGSVKRLVTAPPFESARQLGASGDAERARSSGLGTGRALRTIGINVDFAPVLDVPGSNGSFLGSRAFDKDPETVARVGVAFAQGLEGARVAATAKHFPGIGTARANTDGADVTVRSARSVLLRRLAPFEAAVRSGIDLVMVSSARYPALDSTQLPALLSPTIVRDLLRRQLGFEGVVVTDTMGGRAVAAFPHAPVRALRAGVDVLLYATSEGASAAGYDLLVRAARAGAFRRGELRQSYDRVLRLKSRVAR
ncbi:MAG: glycoside hydrolase family 3 N-terminal domain-containing protein [Gaiellaceae bacterium]